MFGNVGGVNSAAGTFFAAPNEIETTTPAVGEASKTRNQNILPVVVSQLQNLKEDEEFMLFGLKAHILVLVGILRNSEITSLKACYEIEDHTGKIPAILWIENDTSIQKSLPIVKEGQYVQVFGTLRSQGLRKFLMLLKMVPVEDINVVTSHLLQVIHARFEAEHMSKTPPELGQIKANNPGAELATSMNFINEGIENSVTVEEDFEIKLTTLQKKVCEIIKADTSMDGLSRTSLLQHFPANLLREVNSAIEFLTCEGLVYCAIDNNHFKHILN